MIHHGRADAGPYLIIGIIKCSVGLKSNICKNIKCYYDSIESLINHIPPSWDWVFGRGMNSLIEMVYGDDPDGVKQ
jgi:hypothetical protein